MNENNIVEGELPNRPLVREDLDTAVKHDLSHQRDERCIPIVEKIFFLLVGMKDLQIGSHVKENKDEVSPYIPVIREVLRTMIDKNIQVADATYIFNLARQAIQAIQSGVDETLNQNMNRVSELVYDLPHNKFNEVTIKRLNDVVQRTEKIKEVLEPVMEDKTLAK